MINFKMLLRPNGYVLEQLLSPLVVHTTPEHDELKQLVPGCLTRNHVHHYLGQEYCALRTRLIEEAAGTSLPASPTTQSALSDMLVRVRLASVLNRE
jgi:RNA repair pathway DNA polymerase beta family